MYITLAIYLRLPLPLSHTSPPLSYPFSTIPQSPCLSLSPPLSFSKNIFHCFSTLFSIFSPYSCPQISAPLPPLSTSLDPSVHLPQQTHLLITHPSHLSSPLSICLLPSFFLHTSFSLSFSFCFPPSIIISLCFRVSLALHLISLSSPRSPPQFFPLSPSLLVLPFLFPALCPRCVCGGSEWSGLPAGINSTGPPPRAVCVYVCVGVSVLGWLAQCPDPPPVVKLTPFLLSSLDCCPD